jgi:cyclic dehypoxanthinyl futalosine synthase
LALTKQQALDMLESDDLVGLGMAAHQLRLKKNDPRVVTYQIDRNINYTNFCTEYCSFCAFYRPLGAKDGYILSFEEIYKKIDEMLELGGTGILLQGGLHPDLQIGYYENLLRSLKARYPQVHLHCFSAPEILCIAEVSEISIRETIQRLMDAGLQSIPGGGAEILDAKVHQRRLGRNAPCGPFPRTAHHRHHDVWLRRRAAPSRQPSRTAAAHSGGYRRVHGVHPVDVCH